jgi:hypothetical protein
LPASCRRRIIEAHRGEEGGQAVPPHWWIPLRGSESQKRCRDVAEQLEGAGRKLHSCWRNPDGTRHYAIAAGDLPDEGLLKAMGASEGEGPTFLADEDDLVPVPPWGDQSSES